MRTIPNILRGGLVTLTVAVSLIAVGCAPTSQQASPAANDGYTIKHAMGETKLASTPKRVVVLDSPQLDALVALGITPVGAPEIGKGHGFPEYLAAKLTGTKPVGFITEPSIDAIANLKPDLILGAKVRHEAIYKELSAIAPTVFSESSGTNWQEQAKLTAAAVNRSADMTKLLEEIDARTKKVGEKIGAAGKTASIVRFLPDNFRLYGPGTFSGSVLTKMGFNLGDRQWNQYSMEVLSPELYEKIDGQVIFYTSSGSAQSGTQARVTKLWSNLPAVKAGKAFAVKNSTWMAGIGVIGAGLVIDQVEKAFAS